MLFDYLVCVVHVRGFLEERLSAHLELLREHGYLLLAEETTELKSTQASLLLGQHAGALEDFLAGPVTLWLLKRSRRKVQHPSTGQLVVEDAYNTFDKLRLELDYAYGSKNAWMALRDRQAFFPKTSVLERVCVLLKPGYSHEEYFNLMTEFQEHDFVVPAKEGRILSNEQAKYLIYAHRKQRGEIDEEEENAAVAASVQSPSLQERLAALELTDLEQAELNYLTSDLSMIFVIEKVGALPDWLLLLGPADPDEAKLYAPHTLRSKFGKSVIQNFIYSSANATQSSKDIEFFFPKPFPLERTLAIIKPDAIPHTQNILNLIELNGFTILARDEVYLSRARAEQFYAHFKGSLDFESLTRYLSSGPCVALLLSKPAAIDAWKKLLGPVDPQVARETKPHTLRAKLGHDLLQNALHGSEDERAASREIEEFFPALPLEKIPDLQQLHDIMTAKPPPRPHAPLQKSLYDVLSDGLTELCAVKPASSDEALLWLADWLLQNNPNKPKIQHPEEPLVQVTLQQEYALQQASPNTNTSTSTSNNASAVASASTSSSTHSAPIISHASPTVSHPLTTSSPLQVVWLVGSPGSNSVEIAHEWVEAQRQKSQEQAGVDGTSSVAASWEHVNVDEILKHAMVNSTEYGPIITTKLKQGKPIPTHIIIHLLENVIRSTSALQGHNGSKYILLSSFPSSLDQAFEFEAKIATPLLFFNLHVTSEQVAASMNSHSQAAAANSVLHSAEYLNELKLYTEEIEPLISHYTTFKKTRTIPVFLLERTDILHRMDHAVEKMIQHKH